MTTRRLSSLSRVALAAVCSVPALRADPAPGGMLAAARAERGLEIPSLAGAVRAEVSVEYWGGHIAGGQEFQVNGGEWRPIQQPEGTPGRPQCYYRTLLGRATTPLPLGELKEGRNVFRFTAGPQLCHGFNWGFYWIYSFTVRLYYTPDRPPAARITSPAPGAEIGDFPRLVAEAGSASEPVSRVEFLAHYEDFNWEGDGEFRQWHYITARGSLARHAGTAFSPPYAVTWDTSWVPDQDAPVRIAARVTDAAGLIYVTPEVGVRLWRRGRSVKMYKAVDVPEAFGVRTGRRKECRFTVDGPLEQARAARIVLSTWSAAHGEEIAFNGAKIAGATGLIHSYSFDALPVPPRLLRMGGNSFSIFSNTDEHAFEVNWPGPVLLVEYGEPAARPSGWADPQRDQRIPVEVNAAGYARADKPAEARLPLPSKAKGVRLVEIGPAGEAIDGDVPFQLEDGGAGDRTTIVWLMKGRTAAHATRRYAVYFGSGADAARQPLEVADGAVFEGQPSVRVATPSAVYTYHKEGAGFASIRDRDGVEWVGYRPGGRSAGEYRGIPNLGDDFGHPGQTGASGSISRLETRGPVRVRIVSERRDGKWACRWDIYPGYASMTMLRNDKPYWFLYEGTPAGTLDLANGFQWFANGLRKTLAESWSGDLPGPEWVAFGVGGRSLFLVNHQDDDAPDQYWPMDGNMTVFGFGREFRCCRQYLDWPAATFTIGFAEGTDYDSIAFAVDSAWRPLRVRVGEVERRPDQRR
jgi:hypothetical protein